MRLMEIIASRLENEIRFSKAWNLIRAIKGEFFL